MGFEWMSFDRAYDRLTYKNAKDTISKAHDHLESLEQGRKLGATKESS